MPRLIWVHPANDEAILHFNLAPPTPVPTLSPVGLAVLALGMVAAFLWVRRTRGAGKALP